MAALDKAMITKYVFMEAIETMNTLMSELEEEMKSLISTLESSLCPMASQESGRRVELIQWRT